MLCAECESLFNKSGEEWVIENCWQRETTFPLRTALMAERPFIDEPGFRAYEARNVSGVDLDGLVYFAVSVFWRAALAGWRLGKGRPNRLMLGPYEEELRLFLQSERPFPQHMLLVVTLSETQDDLNNRNMALPFGGERSDDGWHYQFVIPGMTFLLLVGKAIPAAMLQIGTAPSGFIFIALKGDTQKLTQLVSAMKDAPRRGKLAKASHSH